MHGSRKQILSPEINLGDPTREKNPLRNFKIVYFETKKKLRF